MRAKSRSEGGAPNVLFRYMDMEDCKRMVKRGVVRLAKSSFYKDGAGMTDFQMDDEQFKSLEFESSGVSEVVDKLEGIDIKPGVERLVRKPLKSAACSM